MTQASSRIAACRPRRFSGGLQDQVRDHVWMGDQ
jgi:hypothetical protein